MSDPRQIAAKERSPTGFRVYKNALAVQPHIAVKDPWRQNVTFRSAFTRFPEGGTRGDISGLHPGFIRPASVEHTYQSRNERADARRRPFTRYGTCSFLPCPFPSRTPSPKDDRPF